jgi:hypothetical protein
MSTLYQDLYENWIMSPGERAVPGTIVSQLLDPDSPEGRAAKRIYDLDLCRNCGQRKAAHNTGDALAVTHGFMSRECDICVYTAALEHTWRRIRALPEILYRLGYAHLRAKVGR